MVISTGIAPEGVCTVAGMQTFNATVNASFLRPLSSVNAFDILVPTPLAAAAAAAATVTLIKVRINANTLIVAGDGIPGSPATGRLDTAAPFNQGDLWLMFNVSLDRWPRAVQAKATWFSSTLTVTGLPLGTRSGTGLRDLQQGVAAALVLPVSNIVVSGVASVNVNGSSDSSSSRRLLRPLARRLAAVVASAN